MLTLSHEQLVTIIEQARAGVPEEVCGILGGCERQVFAVYPARNAAEHRLTAYRIDPHDQLRIMEEIEARGWEIVGIYHSHPTGPPTPSPTDLREAHAPGNPDAPYYPHTCYLIVSLTNRAEPSVRAFRIVGGRFREEPLQIRRGKSPEVSPAGPTSG
jgi:proteasome lid subunit RPN8/RPN11